MVKTGEVMKSTVSEKFEILIYTDCLNIFIFRLSLT